MAMRATKAHTSHSLSGRVRQRVLDAGPSAEREWEATSGHSLLSRVLKVKRIFSVSYKTVLYRLLQSPRETAKVWRAFQSQHGAQFDQTLRKASEPAGLTRHNFMGDRLHRLVRLRWRVDAFP